MQKFSASTLQRTKRIADEVITVLNCFWENGFNLFCLLNVGVNYKNMCLYSLHQNNSTAG